MLSNNAVYGDVVKFNKSNNDGGAEGGMVVEVGEAFEATTLLVFANVEWIEDARNNVWTSLRLCSTMYSTSFKRCSSYIDNACCHDDVSFDVDAVAKHNDNSKASSKAEFAP